MAKTVNDMESETPDNSDQIDNTDADYVNKAHDDYLEERAKLIDGERESSRSFEKYLITLSSGALGLSLVFIEKVVPKPEKVYLICTAWVAFAFALICMLIAFVYSQKAYKEQRNILDKVYTKTGDPNATNKASVISEWLCTISLVIFVVGVFFMVAFSAINFYSKEKHISAKIIPTQKTYSSGVVPSLMKSNTESNQGAVIIKRGDTTIIVPR